MEFIGFSIIPAAAAFHALTIEGLRIFLIMHPLNRIYKQVEEAVVKEQQHSFLRQRQ
jgi:hypothetical protein